MSVTDTAPPVITEPGVYDGIPAEDYHRHASLSSSGARRLLPPSCPALFAYEREHGQGHKTEWDIGHAAHLLVLGEGPELVLVDADDWRTKAARSARDDAHAAGKVPLLPDQYGQVRAMAAALRQHPAAGPLFEPGSGQAELSMFWVDPGTGMWLRARPDWLPTPRSRRHIIADYKTARDASETGIQKAVYEHGYHQQAAWYMDGARALGVTGELAMVFVFQEKTPPYLVNVVELDVVALKIGRAQNRRAINLFAQCTASGHWPGYSDDITRIPLPAWAEVRHAEDIAS